MEKLLSIYLYMAINHKFYITLLKNKATVLIMTNSSFLYCRQVLHSTTA